MISLIDNIKKQFQVYTLFALIAAFFGKKLISLNGNFIGGIDVAGYFYWNALFIKEQILSGNIPLWNPYIGGGMPLDINTTFYPTTLLYLFFPVPWAFNLETFLHIFLAAVGMYCFVSILTGSKNAGLVSGIIYGLNGYMMDRIFAGHTLYFFSAALLPWIIFFVEKSFQKKAPSFLIISGLILGLQILSCDAQNTFYIALTLTVYFFIRLIFLSNSCEFKLFFRWSAFYLLIPTTAFGISAIHLFSYWEFVSLTTHGKFSFDACTYYSFPIKNFFTFLVPKASTPFISTEWEFGGYVGILSLFLSGLGMLFSKYRRYKWCMGIISLISVTLMVGNQTPIYQFYYNYFPIISSMRSPGRAIVIFVFTMAVFAGLGVQYLTESRLSKKQFFVALVGIILCLLTLIIGGLFFKIPLKTQPMLIAFSLLFISFVVLCILQLIKRTYLITALLAGVVFFDLMIIYTPQIPILNQNELLAKRNYEKIFEDRPEYYRVALPGYLINNRRALGLRYFDAIGYAPLFLNNYYQFIHQMADINTPPEFFRYLFNPELFNKEKVFSSKILGIKYALVQTSSEGYHLIEAKEVLPRASLVREAIFLPELEDHIRYMKNPSFDPQKKILLLSSEKNLALPETKIISHDGEGSVNIISYRPNRISLKTESMADGYLLLSEIYYPGWQAYVDGKNTPILRADYLLRAVPLSGGNHEISFIYRPMGLIVGAIVTTVTILLMTVMLIGFKKYK